MRSIAKLGLAAFGAVAMMACSHDSQNPANSPQSPTTSTTPQQSNDPIAQNGIINGQTNPASSPTPQSPAFGAGAPQNPALDAAGPQKPFGTSGDATNPQLAKTEKPLSDAEILGVVETVNDGEVQMADGALKKATDKDVKSFATMMKTMHTQGLAKAKATETKTKITHQDSDLSSFLKSDVAKTQSDLSSKTGKDFDKAYIDAQVTAHKNALAAIDNRLMPGVQNGEVKALLTETRKTVVDHIAKAEEVQKKVGGMASNDIKGDDKSTSTGLDSEKSAKAKGIQPTP